jgi:hypothetical protein
VLERLRALIREGRYRLTLHAEEERDADRITIDEIETTFADQNVEVVEDYANDPRGHSMLVLGFTASGNPLHAVCSIHENLVIFITVYRPNPRLWIEWRIRKGARS